MLLSFGAVVKPPPPPPPPPPPARPSPAAPSIPPNCPLSSLNGPPVAWDCFFPAIPPLATEPVVCVFGSHGEGAGTKPVPVSGCFGGKTSNYGRGLMEMWMAGGRLWSARQRTYDSCYGRSATEFLQGSHHLLEEL